MHVEPKQPQPCAFSYADPVSGSVRYPKPGARRARVTAQCPSCGRRVALVTSEHDGRRVLGRHERPTQTAAKVLHAEAVAHFKRDFPAGTSIGWLRMRGKRYAFVAVESNGAITRVDRRIAKVLGRVNLPENGDGLTFRGYNYAHAVEAIETVSVLVGGVRGYYKAVEL